MRLLREISGNGHGESAKAEDRPASTAEKIAAELTLQVEAVLVRHMVERGIAKEHLQNRVVLCQTNWPAPGLDEDGLLMRKWFRIDGTDVPFPCVQVRLTGPSVFVETIMKAGVRT